LNSSGISVLIVDHEESARATLAGYLGAKYKCVTAKSADEAMTQLAAASFSLAITDIAMVSTSGVPLCSLINTTYSDTVIVAVSKTNGAECAIEAMRQGAFEYLAKPFDFSQVRLSVEHALQHRRLSRKQRALRATAASAAQGHSVREKQIPACSSARRNQQDSISNWPSKEAKGPRAPWDDSGYHDQQRSLDTDRRR
jgi:DNA-binding NtrC family response regulator